MSASGAVQACVAHYDGFIVDEACGAGMPQNELAAGHPFADIVIGIAFEMHVHPTSVPHAKALTHVAGQPHGQRRILHCVVTPPPGDLTGETRTDGAVVIADLTPLAALPGLDGRQHVPNHALSELTLVKR